jgi:hypothetical protein
MEVHIIKHVPGQTLGQYALPSLLFYQSQTYSTIIAILWTRKLRLPLSSLPKLTRKLESIRDII